MSNFEPEPLRIDTEDGTFEFDRKHAYLYTFIGELACYDHVFLLHEVEEGEEVPTAEYIWSDNEIYPLIAEYLKDNDFPQCINSPTVQKQDREVFSWHFGTDNLPDTIPEHWTDDGED